MPASYAMFKNLSKTPPSFYLDSGPHYHRSREFGCNRFENTSKKQRMAEIYHFSGNHFATLPSGYQVLYLPAGSYKWVISGTPGAGETLDLAVWRIQGE